MTTFQTGTAAGVPYVVLPPESPTEQSPLVIVWHLQDAPNTPQAMAAALPLDLDNAWRVYLTVPMSGARVPGGNVDIIMEEGMRDAVRNLQVPIITQGGDEFPAVLAEVRSQLGVTSTTVALVGASIGSAILGRVALDVAPANGIDLAALVVISPVACLKDAVDTTAVMFGFAYPWDDESLALVAPMDLAGRARELGDTPLLAVVGTEDAAGFIEPTREFVANARNAELFEVNGMGHALAEQPGNEPAPQTPHARIVDEHVTAWLKRQLG